MERYVAFLRGVNRNGKNKIVMAEWKAEMERLGFLEVKTYLNSGNAVFSTERQSDVALEIETMIQEKFHLEIPVLIMQQKQLKDILLHGPSWWGTQDQEIYDNLIFMFPSVSFADVLQEIGEPKEGLEQIEPYGQAIFWSFCRKDYQKTNWWSKTASASVGSQLTIRTANTVRKLIGM